MLDFWIRLPHLSHFHCVLNVHLYIIPNPLNNLPQFSYHEGQHPLVFAFVQYYYFVAENDDGHLWMNHSQGNEAELEVLGRGVWQLGHDFDNKLLDPPWTFNRK